LKKYRRDRYVLTDKVALKKPEETICFEKFVLLHHWPELDKCLNPDKSDAVHAELNNH